MLTTMRPTRTPVRSYTERPESPAVDTNVPATLSPHDVMG